MHVSRAGHKIDFSVNLEKVDQLKKLKEEFSRQGKSFPVFGVLVLTYNASEFIEKTISRIPREVEDLIGEIFIFDDNSPDKTFETALELKEKSPWQDKLTVFKNHKNLRYGGNQKVGYTYGINQGMDYIIMLHGDGQYAPEYIPDLMLGAVEDGSEVVFASRMMNKMDALKGGMPLYKFVGNQVLTKFENIILGTSLYEFHSGYRMYSTKVLKSLPLFANTDEFHFDTEIIIQCRHLGIKIKEVPIKTFYGDEECNVDGFRYAFDVCVSVLNYRLHQLHLTRIGSYILNQDAIYTRKRSPYSSHSLILSEVRKNMGEKDMLLFLHAGNPILKDALEDYELKTINTLDVDLRKSALQREYNVIILSDTLCKVKHPISLLKYARNLLLPEGKIIVSAPNIVLWAYRLSVLIGRFNYAPKGALDKSNLRFLTKFSFMQAVINAGFKIEKIKPTSLPFEVVFESSGKSRVVKILDSIYAKLANAYHKLFAYEFVITASVNHTITENIDETFI